MGFIIKSESHVDHGIDKKQMEWLQNELKEKKGFFIETLELPARLKTVPCRIYGPVVGDPPVEEKDVYYARRGNRKGKSRLVDWQPRTCRRVTVIAGPHGGDNCVLYTAFGGPPAPKEPCDPTLSGVEMEESKAFWAEHALCS